MAEEQLTEDLISELKEAFSVVDTEGKGSIRIEDVSSVLRSFLKKHDEISDFHEVMSEAEADGKGEIDFAELLAIIRRRMKVKVDADSDFTSLYALCRQWLKNDIPRKKQPIIQNFAKPLPKPLPLTSSNGPETNEDEAVLEVQSIFENHRRDDIGSLSEQDLLENHMQHFKVVRKRLRDRQKERIERYKIRLALLLHPGSYQDKVDT